MIIETPKPGISRLATLSFPSHTLIFNRQVVANKWDRLFPLVQRPIAGNWDEFKYTKRSGHKIGWVDDNNAPRFFAKKKTYVKPSSIQLLRATSDTDLGEIFDQDRKTIYAFNSLANELYLSPQISAVLTLTEVQQVVQSFGFSGITYAEPLAGMIDRRNQYKFMVYDFVKGRTVEFTRRIASKFEGYQIAFEVTQMLKKLFLAAFINPTDLNDTSLLVTKTPEGDRLVLIDTEAYTQI